jgi:hypothetical protein
MEWKNNGMEWKWNGMEWNRKQLPVSRRQRQYCTANNKSSMAAG